MKKIVTAKELAAHLSVSTQYIYARASSGDLPTLNLPGQIVRFDLEHILSLLTTPTPVGVSSLKTEESRKVSHRKRPKGGDLWL